MGFLLVFFPEDDFSKKKLSSPSPSSLVPSPPSPAANNNKPSIRRSNSSSSDLILTRAQSTISICALLVFITLLLFTLSTFEPTPVHTSSSAAGVAVSFSSRRHLSGRPASRFPNSSPSWAVSNLWQSHQNTKRLAAGSSLPSHAHALQRMGTLFLRGTKSMNDLIVVHLLEGDSLDHVRVFLRLFLHTSGLASKSDVVFVFPHRSTGSSNSFDSIIQEESDAFVKLLTRYREQLNDSAAVPSSAGFDVSHFMRRNENDGGNNKRKKKAVVRGESIWGKRSSNNYSSINRSSGARNSSVAGESGSEAELNYGSVVSFETAELDPENSLAGFFDHVPMSLRRWACYPMLLGRVRRSYKHVMLVELRSYLIVGDPLVRVRNKSPESVLITTGRKKNADRVNAGIIMGGNRGIRRMSSAMVTEIVRAGMQQQQKGKKHPVTETSVLSQMVRNELVLRDSVKIVTWGGESTAEESWSVIKKPGSLSWSSGVAGQVSRHGGGVVRRGGNNSEELERNRIIRRKICESPIESWVYGDCNDDVEKYDTER